MHERSTVREKLHGSMEEYGAKECSVFVLVLVMIFAMPGRVSAAWEKNTDGTYSWYQNGKLKKNSWISGTYYVNAKGFGVPV